MKKLFSILLLIFVAIGVHAQDNIQVQVHNVVSLDEQFQVNFVIEGKSPSEFHWEPSEDFTLVWGPQQGKSSSIQIINGKRTESSSTTYSYILKPVKPGKFVISKARAVVKGKEIFSKEKTIEVIQGKQTSSSVQSSAQHPSSARQQSYPSVSGDNLFLRLTLDRNQVVVGEPIVATLKLYQRVNITGFEGVSFPSFNGFWSQEIESPSNVEFVRETYDGQIYNAAVLRKFLLIPQQKGALTIDPAELVCIVNVRASSGGRSLFDEFFDDYRTVRQKVTTNPVTVSVSPLPAGAPASFAGGVGKFKISASVSKDTLKAHDAASLIITVSGKGNVSLLESPKVSFPPDMEVYDAKVVSDIAPDGLSGTKTYEIPFIPRSHGDFVIEPVNYSYYDVASRNYVTLQTDPLNFTVLKGAATEGATIVAPGVIQKDVRNLDSDIRFINTRNTNLVAKGSFLISSLKLWIVVILLCLAAFILWLSLRRIAARKADVVGTKNRKATKMALKRLKLAHTFLVQNLYTAFYEELHKALLGFISDKLNIPLSGLSRDRMVESLKNERISDKDINVFISILDDCEFARYSPSSGNDAMAAHYEAAVEVISSIDSSMKPKSSKNAAMKAVLCLLMLSPVAASADSDSYVDSLWNEANAAYVDGSWMQAAEGYEMILDMGLESAALYCNIGNAYFKDGNISKAILYYERALKLDPSYEDAQYNLQLMNAGIQDRIEVVPEFFLKKWMRDICYLMDSDAWAITFVVFLALTLALTLVFVMAPSIAWRRTGFFVGIVTMILMISSLTFSLWQKNDYQSADQAIVIKAVASVKSSPSTEATKDLFILHEGTKVLIIDRVGDWNNVSLSDGRQGWLPAADMEVI